MSPAYHTTGRSAALHSETYGSAEIRAITVASGRFYRKPPAGFTDHPLLTPRGALIAGRAEQQAAMQKAAADYARLVPSVRWLDPAEALRRQPLLKPEAAAGGAIFEEAEDMDVAAIHGGFLKGARAAGAVLRLDAEVTDLDRKDGRWTIRLRDGESVARQHHRQRLGRLGRRAGRPGRRARRSGWCRSGAPPSPSTRRRASTSRRLPMAIDFDETWYIKPEVGQFLGSPADETPSPPCDAQPEEIDIAIAVERIETATHALRSGASRTNGRACAASSPTRTWWWATTPRSKASSGWPARAATASRPARRRDAWPPALRWARACRPTSLHWE